MEFLHYQIMRELRKQPLTRGELAERVMPENEVQKVTKVTHALYDLADMGKVAKSLFGERWETTSGGYCPEPGGAA